jgi:hypothetical protein
LPGAGGGGAVCGGGARLPQCSKRGPAGTVADHHNPLSQDLDLPQSDIDKAALIRHSFIMYQQVHF